MNFHTYWQCIEAVLTLHWMNEWHNNKCKCFHCHLGFFFLFVCSDGEMTAKLCPDGMVFNDYSPDQEKCDLPFNIDCSQRSKLRKCIRFCNLLTFIYMDRFLTGMHLNCCWCCFVRVSICLPNWFHCGVNMEKLV